MEVLKQRKINEEDDDDDVEVEGRTNPDNAQQKQQKKQMQKPKKNHYLLLIHGSCASPHDWWQQGHDHGIALASALNNMEPLFLHYNTGLHISENGKLLSQSIRQLVNEQRRRLLTMEKKDDTLAVTA